MAHSKTLIERRSTASNLFDWFIYILFGIYALLCIYPFWYMLIYSISDPVKVSAGVYLLPQGFSLFNLQKVFELKGIASAVMMSVLRTAVGTGLTVFACSFLGYLSDGRAAFVDGLFVPYADHHHVCRRGIDIHLSDL